MSYAVKEIFYTLQGEGGNAGRAAVFCRFTGCNLWSGREVDREKAVCQFCDTDFVGTDGLGGGKFATASELAQAIAASWSSGVPGSIPGVLTGQVRPLVVCTGGEPLLQLDEPLLAELHRLGFEVAVETNGTVAPDIGAQRIDWLCVSPKAGSQLVLTSGDELKLVFPQSGAAPEQFVQLPFRHFFLQPMDGLSQQANTAAAVDYCLRNPQWRLSLQTHKLLGIP